MSAGGDQIKAGQVYRSADPRDDIRIRIKSYYPGAVRAQVVDAESGKRQRQILVKNLHASPITRAGRRRHSGYVLEQGRGPVTEIRFTADTITDDELDKLYERIASYENAISWETNCLSCARMLDSSYAAEKESNA